MNASEARIRRALDRDAAAMAELFHETVHRVNAGDYTAAQLRAWSPRVSAARQWRARQRGKHVWVCETQGKLAGFAELDPDGRIDCFFVAHDCQGQGVGTALMQTLLQAATRLGLPELVADVSVTARAFFLAQGFRLAFPQQATRRGVAFQQYRMSKVLPAGDTREGAGI